MTGSAHIERYRKLTRILNLILDCPAANPALFNAVMAFRSNPSDYNREKLKRIVG